MHILSRRRLAGAELLARLGESGAQTLLVGEDVEAPRRFWSFLVGSGPNAVEIGVISSGHGMAPAVIELDHGLVAIIGHDFSLTWVDLSRPAVTSSRAIGGVFYEFLPVESGDEVIILHELGALRVHFEGGDQVGCAHQRC